MQKLFITALIMFSLSNVILADDIIEATPLPGNACLYAILTTERHFEFGDGSVYGVEVLRLGGSVEPPAPPIATAMGRFIDGRYVRCDLYGEYCPEQIEHNENPHLIPDVGRCTGCSNGTQESTNTTINTSIQEAKCCLMYGTTTSPNGDNNC
jgi:hypothetical protein